jgi:hypothetical protein
VIQVEFFQILLHVLRGNAAQDLLVHHDSSLTDQSDLGFGHFIKQSIIDHFLLQNNTFDRPESKIANSLCSRNFEQIARNLAREWQRHRRLSKDCKGTKSWRESFKRPHCRPLAMELPPAPKSTFPFRTFPLDLSLFLLSCNGSGGTC